MATDSFVGFQYGLTQVENKQKRNNGPWYSVGFPLISSDTGFSSLWEFTTE